MPKITETRIMPFNAKQIFDIVIDIENYPNFLPWCQSANICKSFSEEHLHAELLINFKNIFEKYTSEVFIEKISPNQYEVKVKAIKGPFKSLINNWKISQIEENKSQVEFYLEFEFNSLILTKILGSVFSLATQKMIDAFENRAHALYQN